MLKVTVHQYVTARDGRGTLTRELLMPFAPFPGLHLDGISFSDDGLVVALVAWDAKEGCLLAHLENDVNREASLESALGFYGDGWAFTPDSQGPAASTCNGRPK